MPLVRNKPLASYFKSLKDFTWCDNLPQFEPLVTYYNEQGRVYSTPVGDYPSVTTVLSVGGDGGIERWRERVGDEEADRISFQATNKGERIHGMCEAYLRGKLCDYNLPVTPHDADIFSRIKSILDDRVDNMRAVEAPLYSKYLKVAGRTDLIAEYKGKLAVIDFKTSKDVKKDEYVQGYFMQGAAYCVMYEEMIGIPINNVVIIISNDYADVQVFERKRNDYIFQFIALRQKFEEMYENNNPITGIDTVVVDCNSSTSQTCTTST